ncbi:hypothetical protein [Bradyrhizobium sp. USDA 4353]
MLVLAGHQDEHFPVRRKGAAIDFTVEMAGKNKSEGLGMPMIRHIAEE